MQKVLVTGAFGQIGSELVPTLQKKYGSENVVALGHHNIPSDFQGIIEKGEITDLSTIDAIIKKHSITTIYHLVSILSAKGEQNPQVTWDVNMNGLIHVLNLAVEHKLRVFWPSSIAVFGPTTPRVNTPQRTILEPTTMYGVTKLAGENLVNYYYLKYGLDVRSVRYPGLISWKAEPGGGTTDYAVAIYYDALRTGHYHCFVSADTTLPMMYMDDAIRGTIELMEADSAKLNIRNSYNFAAMSFTAQELAENIQKLIPLTVTYGPDHRQQIANSWPQSIDDSLAHEDWGWEPKIDLPEMTDIMLKNLRKKLNVK